MTYYIRNNGSDSNDGRHWRRAWGTLAAVRRCKPGDVVSVRGEYREPLIVPSGVTVEGPATIITTDDWAIQVRNAVDVRISRIHAILESPPESGYGCAILGGSSRVTLRDCWLHGSGHWDREVLLLHGSDDCLVSGCTVTIPESETVKALRGKRGICIRGSGNVVERCVVRVPSLKPQGTWNGTSGITVYAGWGPNSEVACRRNVIRDTTVAGCSYYGIGFYRDAADNVARRCRVMGSGYAWLNSLSVPGSNRIEDCWSQTPRATLQAQQGELVIG